MNFAAESHNSLAVVDPARFFRTNVLGTQALLEAGRRAGLRRFHHVSTCEVYGDLALDSAESLHRGVAVPAPDPVQRVEGGADHAVRAYAETYGLAVTITNCCNNYGPYQFPEKVIPLFTTQRARRQLAPALRVDRSTGASGSTSTTTAGPSTPCSSGARWARRTTWASGLEASIEEIADEILAALGKPSVAQDDRARSSRPRPPLPARLHEDPQPSWAGSRRSRSSRAWPTRWRGTRPTGPGGSRCATGPRCEETAWAR